MKPIEARLQQTRQISHNLIRNARNSKQSVTDHIKHCKEQLELVEKELLDEIDSKATEKSLSLQQQAEELEVIVQKFATAGEFTKKVLQSANEVEMMLVKNHIMARLRRLDGIEVELQPRDDDVVQYKFCKEDFEKCLAGGCVGHIMT